MEILTVTAHGIEREVMELRKDFCVCLNWSWQISKVMQIHQVLFLVIFTILSALWVYQFKLFIYGQVEEKALETIKRWAAPPERVEGVFVYRILESGERLANMTFLLFFTLRRGLVRRKKCYFPSRVQRRPMKTLFQI